MAPLAATAMLWALSGAQILADDFEDGQLTGPGSWTQWRTLPTSPVPLQLTSAAAHRGDGGLTYTLVPDGGNTNGFGSWLEVSFPAVDAGTVSLRYWIRERLSNLQGAVIVNQLLSPDVRGNAVAELAINHGANNRWSLQGYDDSDAGQSIVNAAPFTMPAWHLIEVDVNRLGTDAGSRVLVLDGQTVADVEGLELSSTTVTGARLGAVFVYTQMSATIDIDDARIGTAPQGTTLTGVAVPAPAGACTPCTLALFDAQDNFADAPYTFAAQLSADAGLLMSAQPDCGGPQLKQVVFTAGPSPTVIYLRADAPGPYALQADYVDFLSRPLVATFSDAGALDAGVLDAGSADAGSADGGGADAGAGDAGPAPDGGSTAPGTYAVGCGCDSGVSPLLLLALLALPKASLRRRRPLRPRRG